MGRTVQRDAGSGTCSFAAFAQDATRLYAAFTFITSKAPRNPTVIKGQCGLMAANLQI